jgi:4-amino-4-deoxy-L-arabinose transferase-like glycosyltransferase
MMKAGELRNLLGLVLLCVVTRLVFLMYWPENYGLLPKDVDGYWGIGANLRAGNGFARGPDPITTATRPPMYPVFLAGVHWLTGGRQGIALASQAVLDAVTCVGIYLLGNVITGSVAAAYVAGLFWALYLPEISEITRFWSEPLCALFVTYAALIYVLARQHGNVWLAGLAGVVFGGAALTRSAFLLLPLWFAALFLLRRGEGLARRALFAGVLLLGLILSMAPWVIRNAMIFRAFIPTYSETGLSLYVGNVTLDDDDYLTAVPVSHAIRKVQARIATDSEWSQAQHSEVELDRLIAMEAQQLIWKHPGRFAKLSLIRGLRLWLNVGFGRPPSWRSVGVAAMNAGLLVLAIIGLVSGWRAWSSRAMPLVVTLIYGTLVPLLSLSVGRHIFPVIPALVVLSASGLMAFKVKLRKSPGLQPAVGEGPRV